MKYTVECRECGNEDITTDAMVTWDVGKQEWMVVCVGEPLAWCDRCGQDMHWRFRKLEGTIDFSDVTDVEFDGVHDWDRPDYADAYVSKAWHIKEDRECTEQELDTLSNSTDFYEKLTEYIQ
jgi:hypothetical protein